MTNIAPVVSVFRLRYWILSKRLCTMRLLDTFAKHCVTRLFALYNLSSICLCTQATIRLPLDGFFCGILCYTYLQKLYVTVGFRWNRYNRAKIRTSLENLCTFMSVSRHSWYKCKKHGGVWEVEETWRPKHNTVPHRCWLMRERVRAHLSVTLRPFHILVSMKPAY